MIQCNASFIYGKWGKVEDFGVFNENLIDYLNHICENFLHIMDGPSRMILP